MLPTAPAVTDDLDRAATPICKGSNVKRNSFVLVLCHPVRLCVYNLYVPVLYPRKKCAEGYRAVDEK